MPCMCWYEPDEQYKKQFKKMCYELVEFIREREKIGDPLDMSINDAKKLIDHIYNPNSCNEKKQ